MNTTAGASAPHDAHCPCHTAGVPAGPAPLGFRGASGARQAGRVGTLPAPAGRAAVAVKPDPLVVLLQAFLPDSLARDAFLGVFLKFSFALGAGLIVTVFALGLVAHLFGLA